MTAYLSLDVWAVGLSVLFPLLIAVAAWHLRLQLSRKIVWAVIRCTLQLSLLGFVLQFIFDLSTLLPVLGFGLIMTGIAGWTARDRMRHHYKGMVRDLITIFWTASWVVVGIGLITGVRASPWYDPQYAIPLLGMVLGNILHGISLGMERYMSMIADGEDQIEELLALGATSTEASRVYARQAIHAGLTPVINTMMVAGIVSIPGMMTGQILAGADVIDAVRYQLFVMFLIVGGTGIGCLGSLWFVHRRVFNAKHQLCLFRLTKGPS